MKAICLMLALSAMAPAISAGAARVPGSAADAALFQESYDHEGAGNNQQALAALDKLSPDKGRSYIALLRKGWLQYRLGRNDLAIDDYRKAIAMAPKAVEPRLGILLPLLADKQWSLVEKHARDVLRLDAENYLATLRLAFALYSQNNFAEAEPLYRKVVSAYPSDTEARAGLGWTLLKLRKNKEAAAVFQALLDFAPKNPLGQQGWTAAGAQ